MQKRTFDRLLKQTKKHWKDNILNASAKELKKHNPITFEDCAICKYFGTNKKFRCCHECFLSETWGRTCMPEVLSAAMDIGDYQDGYITIRPVRAACKEAYRAILKRFKEYEEKHWGINDVTTITT